MIEGKNVLIRPLELGDEEYLYKWWNDSKMMAHAGFSFGTLQSREAIRLEIMKQIENGDIFPTGKRFIVCKKDDLKPIGEMNYCGWDKRNQKCEFGIKICEEQEQGKGYGKDALGHFIDFLFKHLNLNKIELTTMKDNQRAQGLYKRLGFSTIGVIRQGYYDSRTGDFTDIVYMDLLKSEWLAVRSGIVL